MQSRVVGLGLISLVSFVLMGACTKELPENEKIKIHVAVTSVTYADFVSKIGGDEVAVSVLIPAGVDPHDFEPSFNKVREISDVGIYFRIGKVFSIEDVWIENIKSNNKSINVVDCSKGLTLKNNNPHMWLGIEEAKGIVENIYSSLSELKPDFKQQFYNNKIGFIGKLDSMDNAFMQLSKQLTQKKLLVYHPAWNYFLSRYGIEEISIEKEGKEPKAGDLREVIDFARKNKVRSIFVEPQFDATSAEAIASEINAEIVSINPMPRDFIENLDDLFNKFSKYLK